jgi:antitoxin ChpS
MDTTSLRKIGGSVMEPRQRTRYTLAELLVSSDYSLPQTAEEREWIDTPAAGRELL